MWENLYKITCLWVMAISPEFSKVVENGGKLCWIIINFMSSQFEIVKKLFCPQSLVCRRPASCRVPNIYLLGSFYIRWFQGDNCAGSHGKKWMISKPVWRIKFPYMNELLSYRVKIRVKDLSATVWTKKCLYTELWSPVGKNWTNLEI